MTLREIKLPHDLHELAPMLSESFQYPENPAWSEQEDERESLVHDINNLARSWWMIRAGQLFIPAMRDLLPGVVWEEDNRIAGVVLLQRRGSSNHWVVTTVATHPDYRRNGIARRLVEAGLEIVQTKHGEIVILDVIDANLPAYKLYQSLGFEHFSGNVDLEFNPQGVHPAPIIPPEYQLEPSSIFEWSPRFQLMTRISPPDIQTYEPVQEGHFRQPGFMRLLMPLIARAQKLRENLLLIRHIPSQQVVGYLRYEIRTGGKGRHTISMRLDPDHAPLAPPLIEHMLHQITLVDRSLLVEAVLPTWQQHAVDAALTLGFEKRVKYHRLGLRVEQDSQEEGQ